MNNLTTLTITKKSKADYDIIREKANEIMNKKFSLQLAFKQSEFFGAMVKFIESNEEEFLESLTRPTDLAFWEGK